MKKIALLFLAVIISCHGAAMARASDNAPDEEIPLERVMPAEDDAAPTPVPEGTGEQSPPPEAAPASEPTPTPEPETASEPTSAPDQLPVPAPEPTAEPATEPVPVGDTPES